MNYERLWFVVCSDVLGVRSLGPSHQNPMVFRAIPMGDASRDEAVAAVKFPTHRCKECTLMRCFWVGDTCDECMANKLELERHPAPGI